MSTIINFKVDKELRDEAKALAKDIGLPLGTIMTHYLKDFVRERRVVFADHPTPNVTTSKRWDTLLQDAKEDKNINRFESAEEAITWLKK